MEHRCEASILLEALWHNAPRVGVQSDSQLLKDLLLSAEVVKHLVHLIVQELDRKGNVVSFSLREDVFTSISRVHRKIFEPLTNAPKRIKVAIVIELLSYLKDQLTQVVVAIVSPSWKQDTVQL